MDKTSSVDILSIRVDALTKQEAIDMITANCKRGGSEYVVKPYVEFFGGGTETKDILNQAWLVLPDGVALQWAAYFQTTSGSLWQLIKSLAEIVFNSQKLSSVLPERFAGTNFTWPLLEAAAREDCSVFLVGSPHKSRIEDTASHLQKNIPGLDIIGTFPGRDRISGNFTPGLEKELLERLRILKPDIVLVGIGFPRQEKLIHNLKSKLDHGILIGEGGTFDYALFGGKKPKAPRTIQKIGLEWLWRLMLEPKRLRRQSAIPKFIFRVYTNLHRRAKKVS